jgi:hypothetical protein
MGAGNFVKDNCRVIPTRLTTTAATVVYTAIGYSHVVGVRIVNYHASNTPVVSFQYKTVADGVAYNFQSNYTIPVAGALWFAFDAFGIYAGDQLLVTSSIANCVDVFVLIAEIPGRSQ